MKTITARLISKDGCEFRLPISSCHLSEAIHAELECQVEEMAPDESDDADNNQHCVTISLTTRIHSSVLQKVIDFLKHFEEEEMTSIEPPFTTEDINEIVQEWYADFITKDVDHLFLLDIISAANFLSIQPLLKLAVLALSININGKSPESLRNTFGMSNNLSNPEQKARVLKENKWVFEARREFEENHTVS